MQQQNVTQRTAHYQEQPPNSFNYPPVQWLHRLILLVQDGLGGQLPEVSYYVLSFQGADL